MSVLKIIRPEAGTNLCTNPSAERDLTGWTSTSLTTFERSTTWQARGAWSVRGIADAVTDAINAPQFTAANGITYRISARVKVISGTWKAETNSGAQVTGLGPGEYEISYDFTEPAGSLRRINLVCTALAAGSAEAYIDAVQYEQLTGYRTTYIDGDEPGCTWSGAPHGSTSTRPASVRTGGREIDIADDPTIAFHFTTLSGLGMPPVAHISQPLAYNDGALLQRIRAEPIVLNISAYMLGGTAAAFHALHRKLVDLVKPDLVPTLQPLTLIYAGSGTELEIDCYYLAGLESTLSPPSNYETFSLQLVAYDPHWRSRRDAGATLTPYTAIANANGILERFNGTWRALGTGVDNGPVYAIEIGPDGSLFAGGAFATAGGVANTSRVAKWNGTAWSALSTGISSGYVFDLLLAPDGRTLYAAGQFSPGPVANAAHLAVWDDVGAAWSSITSGGSPTLTASTPEMAALLWHPDGVLYVGGDFDAINGLTTQDGRLLKRLVRYDTRSKRWEGLHATAPSGEVLTLEMTPDGRKLYAGGIFADIGNLTAANFVASYDPATALYSKLGDGLNSSVYRLLYGPNGLLYAAGIFTQEAYIATLLRHTAAWNGSQWFGLSDGLGLDAAGASTPADTAVELAFSETGELLAGGYFQQVASGVVPVDGVARWNGSTWNPLDVDLPARARVWDIQTRPNRLVLGYSAVGTAIAAAHTTVVNAGSTIAYPRFTFIGPGILRSIRNWTTGEEILLTYTLQAGERLEIDLRPDRRTVTSSVRGNVINAIAGGSQLGTFRLVPGSNDLAIFMTEAPVIFHRDTKTTTQTTGTSITVTKPTGLEDGDRLFAFVHMQGPDAGTITMPAGWNFHNRVGTGAAAGDAQIAVYSKPITNAAGEPASYTWDFAGTNREAAATISAYRGAGHPDTAAAMITANGVGTTFHPFWGMVTSARNTLVLFAAAVNGGTTNSFTPPRGTTERADITNSSGVHLGVADVIVLAPGIVSVNFDESFTSSVSGTEAATMSLSVPPAAAATPPSAYVAWREQFWGADG